MFRGGAQVYAHGEHMYLAATHVLPHAEHLLAPPKKAAVCECGGYTRALRLVRFVEGGLEPPVTLRCVYSKW